MKFQGDLAAAEKSPKGALQLGNKFSLGLRALEDCLILLQTDDNVLESG